MMEPSRARKATEPMNVTARYRTGSLLSMSIRNLLITAASAAQANTRYQFLHESPSITLTRVCRQALFEVCSQLSRYSQLDDGWLRNQYHQ